MDTKKCLRCNHTWISRTDDPVMCPKCKRHDWKKQNESEEEMKQAPPSL